jgi:hypothetical protein
MQRKHWTLISFGFVAIAAAAHASGCRTNGCNVDPDCNNTPGTGGSAGGGPLAECIPAKNHELNGGPVKEECGYFVRLSGDDVSNTGTKTKPFATITRAIEAAKTENRPIYLCAESFPEAVEVPKGINLYGGLNCAASWIYIGATKKTTIAPEPDLVPIKFPNDGEGLAVHIEDVVALAADATLPGGSSIAAIADSVTIELVRSELIAGIGKFGDDGTTPDAPIGPTMSTDPAIVGQPGSNACMGGANGNPGGPMVANGLCDSSGGSGGTGKETLGEDGSDGLPLPSSNPQGYGTGGDGAVGADNCKSGQNGALGDNGVLGVGATGNNGTIDFDGYRGMNGSPGAAGRPGQGGGGGGAAKGKLNCHGASGGSGGAGGCGGKGGSGGQAGGASIALISLGATLVFDTVKLTASTGGNGGGGGVGQQGAIGGNGGMGGLGTMVAPATFAACNGGNGGSGGTGGRGGGGRGGHSIGIAWMGVAPPEALMDSIEFGQAGNGGLGDDETNAGAEGLAAKTLEFK